MFLTTKKNPFGNCPRTCQTHRNETKGNGNNATASLGSSPGVKGSPGRGKAGRTAFIPPILSSPSSPVLDLADEPTQDHNNAAVNLPFFLSIAGLFTFSGIVPEVSYLNPQDQFLLKTRTMKPTTHPPLSLGLRAPHIHQHLQARPSQQCVPCFPLSCSEGKFWDPQDQEGARKLSLSIHVSSDLARYSLEGPLHSPLSSKQ